MQSPFVPQELNSGEPVDLDAWKKFGRLTSVEMTALDEATKREIIGPCIQELLGRQLPLRREPGSEDSWGRASVTAQPIC